ncbi:MAG TPA: tyrosine-protein phosphatase [Acidimicrobiales bacterium]|nr:tyrosine-protein phosphatase [Acidimicrobiales bacterium]
MAEAKGPGERSVGVVGALNFRDVGGYPTADGRCTRFGRVFRSDTLSELTEADVELVHGLGVATVVDLRTPTEVERDGVHPLDADRVHYANLSLLNEEGGESMAAPAEELGMAARYLWYLEIGSSVVAEALAFAGDEARYPIVYHCTAGKDRTGVVTALLLSLAGVERAAVVDDYAATSAAMPGILDRLRRHPVYGRNLDSVPKERFEVTGETMEQFLAGVDERYGGPLAWAESVGLGEDYLAVLRANLLDG